MSDEALAIIDKLADERDRLEFFKHVIELGLCEVIESASRIHRDYVNHTIAGQTKDYRLGRSLLFQVDDPTPENDTPPSQQPAGSSAHDPMMGLRPRK